MSEQLSGFADNTSQHRMEDTRQAEIARLLDERQKVVTELRTKLLGDKVLEAKELAKIEEEIKKDPNVLVINERLLELTGPRAAGKFSEEIKNQVEGEISSAFEADRTKGFFKLADFENMSEGQKFIKAEQNKIVNLRRRLITYLLPQIIDEKFKNIILAEIDVYDKEYIEFQSKVDLFAEKDDLEIIKAEFENDFEDWYSRLLDIYNKVHSGMDRP